MRGKHLRRPESEERGTTRGATKSAGGVDSKNPRDQGGQPRNGGGRQSERCISAKRETVAEEAGSNVKWKGRGPGPKALDGVGNGLGKTHGKRRAAKRKRTLTARAPERPEVRKAPKAGLRCRGE